MDTRLLTLVVWGGSCVILFSIVLLRRLQAWHIYRDRAARREALEAMALWITAAAAAMAISVVLVSSEATNGLRGILTALSLGAFVGVGIIMVTEEPRRRKGG